MKLFERKSPILIDVLGCGIVKKIYASNIRLNILDDKIYLEMNLHRRIQSGSSKENSSYDTELFFESRNDLKALIINDPHSIKGIKNVLRSKSDIEKIERYLKINFGDEILEKRIKINFTNSNHLRIEIIPT